jgi:hypothetical protein
MFGVYMKLNSLLVLFLGTIAASYATAAENTADYNSSNSDKTNLVIVGPGTVTPTNPNGAGITDPATGARNFELVYSNVAEVKYTYRGNASSFMVNASYAPYGFILNLAKTTCPTGSWGVLNGSCTVTYNYLDQRLSNALFYTHVATGKMITVNPPDYQIYDNSGIHQVVPDHDTTATRIIATSFATIRATDERVPADDGPSRKAHKITFTLDNYDRDNLLPGAILEISPDWPEDDSIVSMGDTGCFFTHPAVHQQCTLKVVVARDNPASSVDLKFLTYSSIDSEYNQINGVVSLKLN